MTPDLGFMPGCYSPTEFLKSSKSLKKMDLYTWLSGYIQSHTVSTAFAELPQERIFRCWEANLSFSVRRERRDGRSKRR